ncbi:hypothetical protein ABW19_dt0207418 [Dactylella cylindrospora]|nr:hypothetical protein ABW19_dt0207418 [Dactylella cylindrospora]
MATFARLGIKCVHLQLGFLTLKPLLRNRLCLLSLLLAILDNLPNPSLPISNLFMIPLNKTKRLPPRLPPNNAINPTRRLPIQLFRINQPVNLIDPPQPIHNILLQRLRSREPFRLQHNIPVNPRGEFIPKDGGQRRKQRSAKVQLVHADETAGRVHDAVVVAH